MFWRRSIIKEVCIRLGPSFQSFWREMTNYIRNSPFTIKNNVFNNHWVFSHNFFLYRLLSSLFQRLFKVSFCDIKLLQFAFRAELASNDDASTNESQYSTYLKIVQQSFPRSFQHKRTLFSWVAQNNKYTYTYNKITFIFMFVRPLPFPYFYVPPGSYIQIVFYTLTEFQFIDFGNVTHKIEKNKKMNDISSHKEQ